MVTYLIQETWPDVNSNRLAVVGGINKMVASEHPEVIKGRRQLIVTDVLDSEEESDVDSIDNGGADSDEEGESILGKVRMRTGFTKSVIEEVEEVQRVVKSFSLSSYTLKPPSLFTQ